MKTMKLVALGIVAGIIVSVVGGLFIYFNFFKSNYDDLQNKNYELVKHSKTLGEQLGKEEKKVKDLEKKMSSKSKELLAKEDQVKFLNKTIFILQSQHSQGEAPLVSEELEQDKYTYEINTDKHFGTIVVICKMKPGEVNYDIASREIEIIITWAVVKQADGSYKVIIESENPEVHLENNEFIYLTEAKKWYQRIHGEALVGGNMENLALELVGGWDGYRLGVVAQYDFGKSAREFMLVGGFGF